jgi:hypothetical protein
MKTKRPFLLWLLSLIFVAVSFRYMLQIIDAIKNWNLLLVIQYRFGPLYPVVQGFFLAGGFILSAILLLSRVNWAPTFSAIVVLLTAVWYWVDREVLNLNPPAFKDQLFSIVVCVVLLGLTLGTLWVLQPYMILSNVEALEESSDSSSSGGTNEQQ